MNFFLSHVDLAPLFYGVIIILGIADVIIKLVRGKIISAILVVAIFVLVFWMHGGTMTGGMAAAVAALLGGWIVIPIIEAYIRRK